MTSLYFDKSQYSKLELSYRQSGFMFEHVFLSKEALCSSHRTFSNCNGNNAHCRDIKNYRKKEKRETEHHLNSYHPEINTVKVMMTSFVYVCICVRGERVRERETGGGKEGEGEGEERRRREREDFFPFQFFEPIHRTCIFFMS